MPLLLKMFSVGLLSAVFFLGCASFPGKELPAYTHEHIAPPAQKLAVSYDVKALMFGKENERTTKTVQDEIEKVLKASPLFSQVGPGVGLGEYQYSFVFRNEGSFALAFLSGFISGFTFTIVPAYGRDEYILTVDVKKEDKVLKTYEYKDHMDSWIQLFLVFLMPSHWPENVGKEVVDNMIMNFLHDFAHDLQSGVLLAAHQ
jgi:hypothetical protein